MWFWSMIQISMYIFISFLTDFRFSPLILSFIFIPTVQRVQFISSNGYYLWILPILNLSFKSWTRWIASYSLRRVLFTFKLSMIIYMWRISYSRYLMKIVDDWCNRREWIISIPYLNLISIIFLKRKRMNQMIDLFLFFPTSYCGMWWLEEESFTRLFLTNSQCKSYFLTKQSQMIELLNEYFVL